MSYLFLSSPLLSCSCWEFKTLFSSQQRESNRSSARSWMKIRVRLTPKNKPNSTSDQHLHELNPFFEPFKPFAPENNKRQHKKQAQVTASERLPDFQLNFKPSGYARFTFPGQGSNTRIEVKLDQDQEWWFPLAIFTCRREKLKNCLSSVNIKGENFRLQQMTTTPCCCSVKTEGGGARLGSRDVSDSSWHPSVARDLLKLFLSMFREVPVSPWMWQM